ncbi:ureidoglycolate lyase [Thioclava sp.]|uniref:ureidoglycolate lyase n=1 Tax=Thioclava sp. TaxID=1933450 RepID=UPI003AA7F8CE
MSQLLSVSRLNSTDFAPYGDVIEVSSAPDKMINAGMCARYHDRASLDFSDGRAGISLFDAKARNLPYVVDMLERHPAGSQAFIPMTQTRFLVIVAQDKDGAPCNIRAFLTQAGQAVNLHRGVWHGVLAPLDAPGLFAVIDRIGAGANLEEHWLDTPYVIETVPA